MTRIIFALFLSVFAAGCCPAMRGKHHHGDAHCGEGKEAKACEACDHCMEKCKECGSKSEACPGKK